METTAGQLLLNEELPEELRDYSRVLDKKGMHNLFTDLATKYPDKYRDVMQKLHEIGAEAVTTHEGGTSLTLESLRTLPAVDQARKALRAKLDRIVAGPGTQSEKEQAMVSEIADNLEPMTKLNYEEALKVKNPLAMQVLSGSRGNASQFKSLTVGDMMFTDHKERPVPIAVLKSFSEGLDPVEYWAGAYTARRGTVSVKFATPKAGFIGKQLSMAAHRLVVTEKDCGTTNGIAVEGNDPDNEGTVLARNYGALTAGSVLTPKSLRGVENKSIIVRSPMTCQAKQGVCQKCAGVRETGTFPTLGTNLGVTAAQAIAEPMTQGAISTKHTTGKIQKTVQKSGLELMAQLMQVPKVFPGGAAVSTIDGRIEKIEPAPQGGHYVYVGDTQHWVSPDTELSAVKGQVVEAGDVLSSGIPNPAMITQYKGIGEGRRYFVDLLRKTTKDNGFAAHRRNLEILSRGLINHVRVTDLDGPADTVPDDVVEYDNVVRDYKPRYGTKILPPKESVGLYLEKPTLHYSIGTRVTPRMAVQLKEHGVESVSAHGDEPSFVPEMTRAMETLSHSDDWMVRLGGFHLKKSLTEAVHRGRTSKEHSTSYIPSLAKGVSFGDAPGGVGY